MKNINPTQLLIIAYLAGAVVCAGHVMSRKDDTGGLKPLAVFGATLFWPAYASFLIWDCFPPPHPGVER